MALMSVSQKWQSNALQLWRRQLRHGRRSRTTFDSVWRAACFDMEAIEAEQDRLPGRVNRLRKLAAAVVVAGAELEVKNEE